MGAYNTLRVQGDPEDETSIVLQFKYGEVWQHDYKIGDEIIWGERKLGTIGNKDAKRVVIEAVPNDYSSEQLYNIFVENNIIVSASLDSGKYKLGKDEFMVVKYF